MWEKTEITSTSSRDETVMIPVVPNDVTADPMKEETDADRLAAARQRGITIGMAIALAALMLCMCGVAIGSFLTRVLAL